MRGRDYPHKAVYLNPGGPKPAELTQTPKRFRTNGPFQHHLERAAFEQVVERLP